MEAAVHADPQEVSNSAEYFILITVLFSDGQFHLIKHLMQYLISHLDKSDQDVACVRKLMCELKVNYKNAVFIVLV